MKTTYLFLATKEAFVAALLTTTLLLMTFLAFEPIVSRSQTTDNFVVSQTIAGEISFYVAPADVTMVGSINGLTGGYATGSTYVVVQTNDSDGYNMTIRFNYATTTGMQAGNGDYISKYTPATTTVGVPDYDWVDNATGNSAEFGYTVSASTSADLDQSFLDNGSDTCNTGSSETTNKCWYNPTSTAETIVNRTSGAAALGATTTIKFKVAVPSAPNPSLSATVYYATATLTATNN